MEWPRYSNKTDLPGGYYFSLNVNINQAYWEELADYLWCQSAVIPIGITASNESNTIAENVRVVLTLPKHEGVMVKLDEDLPGEPSVNDMENRLRNIGLGIPEVIKIRSLDKHWEIEIKIGSIQPKSHAWACVPFYICCPESQTLEFAATVYGNNIGEPQGSTVSLDVEVEPRPALTMDALRAYDEQTDRA